MLLLTVFSSLWVESHPSIQCFHCKRSTGFLDCLRKTERGNKNTPPSVQWASRADLNPFKEWHLWANISPWSLTSSSPSVCLLSFIAPELQNIFLQADSSRRHLSPSSFSILSLTRKKYLFVCIYLLVPQEKITLHRCVRGKTKEAGTKYHLSLSVFVHPSSYAPTHPHIANEGFCGENSIKVKPKSHCNASATPPGPTVIFLGVPIININPSAHNLQWHSNNHRITFGNLHSPVPTSEPLSGRFLTYTFTVQWKYV